MRIVFISEEIGVEAPGIVYDKIIRHLTEKCDLSLFSNKISEDLADRYHPIHTVLPRLNKFPYLIERGFFAILGIDILSKFWATKSVKAIVNKIARADVVITAIASNDLSPLYIGNEVAKKLQAKWVVYSVDAIPAPLGWSKDNRYYRSLRRFMMNKTREADAFFSSNPVMLAYQKTCLAPDFNGCTGVVFTPFSFITVNTTSNLDTPQFLYTGNIYGLRHIDSLLSAFSKFVAEFPNAKMVFVGNIDKSLFKGYESFIDNGNILLVGYTTHLDEYYSQSTVMLDLSADIPNDVFLSSKIVNYLPLGRTIVAIGGENSSASVIFKGDNSIIISSYCEKDILIALKKSILPDCKPGEMRSHYIDKFSDKVVADDFYDELHKIVSM